MRLRFLVEEPCRYDGMPLDVVHRLTAWGHHVDVLWPGRSLVRLSEPTTRAPRFSTRRAGASARGVCALSKKTSAGPATR